MSQVQSKNLSQSLPQKSSANSDEAVFGNSSYLAKGSYDSSSLTLTIDLKNGTSLSYWPVYAQVWEQMKQAPSPGSFYARAVKGKYQNTQIVKPLKPSDLPRSKKI